MDYLKSLQISASGLAANKKRMDAISSNIANSQVTRTAEGGPYRRKEVVMGAEPARKNFADILEGEIDADTQTVHATEVISTNRPPKMVYNPGHPDAGPDGMVLMPDINTVEEMANMIEASRSYEANLSALNTSKAMAIKALEIGKN